MKRDKLRIIVSILENCLNGANKTKIVYKTNLNFKVANTYLDMLKSEGLLVAENPGPREICFTSMEGKDLLKTIKMIYGRFEQYNLEA
jgi:predicted transcriptional regulator